MALPSAIVAEYPSQVFRVTREIYHRMIDAGVFEGRRAELVRGEIVEMSPQKRAHSSTITRLTMLLAPVLAGRADVAVQLPLSGPDSEPEPDLAVLPPDLGGDDHPDTALLVIEVAESSVRYDRLVKGPLYAEMAVPEYWLVDLPARRIEVHTEPVGGVYRQQRTHLPGESVTLGAFPDVTLAVDDILPSQR